MHQERVAHRAERVMHQEHASHQRENPSVNLHARGALGRARGAQGFHPENLHTFTFSPHQIAR